MLPLPLRVRLTPPMKKAMAVFSCVRVLLPVAVQKLLLPKVFFRIYHKVQNKEADKPKGTRVWGLVFRLLLLARATVVLLRQPNYGRR